MGYGKREPVFAVCRQARKAGLYEMVIRNAASDVTLP